MVYFHVWTEGGLTHVDSTFCVCCSTFHLKTCSSAASSTGHFRFAQDVERGKNRSEWFTPESPNRQGRRPKALCQAGSSVVGFIWGSVRDTVRFASRLQDPPCAVTESGSMSGLFQGVMTQSVGPGVHLLHFDDPRRWSLLGGVPHRRSLA